MIAASEIGQITKESYKVIENTLNEWLRLILLMLKIRASSSSQRLILQKVNMGSASGVTRI
jgi:hypothetical protein